MAARDDALRPVAERVVALDGALEVESTPTWGSVVDVRLPLDPPAAPEPLLAETELSPREREVFHLVASGARNHDIATTLGISENTVKFHVSNLLHKTGSRSRGELAALLR